VLLSAGKDCLKTDDLQFGFKVNSSTTLCSTILNEVNSYFTKTGGQVYALFLDASKAFDRVDFIKLFQLLIVRGLNALLIRFLLKLYTKQTLRIYWNGIVSDSFMVTNGVKQGGVLSPILFCIYLDEMIQRLRDLGFGCHVGPHFTGVLAYADDVVLLSPTYYGLQVMADKCVCFAKEYNMIFNPSKSQFVKFRSAGCGQKQTFNFSGADIKESEFVSHLGHKLFANIAQHDLDGIIGNFYKQFNCFRSRFGNVHSAVQSELFQTHCSSFYGSLLLPLDKCIKRLQVVWRKSMRTVWNLSPRTHCAIVACLMNKFCDLHIFMSRSINFTLKSLQHENMIVSYILNTAVQLGTSTFFKNFKLGADSLNLTTENFHLCSEKDLSRVLTQLCHEKCKPINDRCKAQAVRDLCGVRDGIIHNFLTFHECNELINELCIS